MLLHRRERLVELFTPLARLDSAAIYCLFDDAREASQTMLSGGFFRSVCSLLDTDVGVHHCVYVDAAV